ncbi:MauE/DoxX family redox-associated membrane protein [Mucilaginibacter jinjuensis]|uniref:Methylamine utilisation protein MauE domain-containing protein n=1 Tax=Mucilaginibacter jinjuensis TaxID=1176721 RepID=A0ABY7TD27_9SPHI|nr:MauE/DoxX family redox-associated membrane protein [Mucilaginibacter jinjuensis]WCT14429.1 hypothetical protein PQO05_10845 [Mucilaginibacter jinjuensis]
MKTFIKLVVPAALIALFTYAAISKLSDINAFRTQLYRQPFAHLLAGILVYGLPATELLAVSLMLFSRTRLAGLLLSAGMLIVFSVYIALGLLHFWRKIPCSCGGILNHMSWQTHLIFNLAFLLASLAAIAVFHAERSATCPNR